MAVKKKDNKPQTTVKVSVNGNVTGNVIIGDGNAATQQLSQASEEKSKEVFFNAGSRLRQVREEIGLTSSEFMEEIGFPSEKKYLAMEAQNEEVPSSLLEKTCTLTGISLDWLKHGKSPRYEIGEIYLNPIEEGLQQCADLNPLEYFFTLELKGLHVGLIAQTGKYRYQVLETGITLDFWNWIDAHWAIPAFYRFLKALSDPWHDIRGVIINLSDDKKLYNGNVHFLATSWKLNLNIVYDILDIDESRLRRSSYSKMYGGNWMSKVHDVFREYLKMDMERNKH